MAYSFPNGLKPKLLHTVVMRAFKMNKTQRNQNHSLEVVFECIWFFRHFGEVVSHSPDKNIQKPMFTTSNAACQGDIFSYLGKIHARNVPYLFLSTGTNPCTSHRGASRQICLGSPEGWFSAENNASIDSMVLKPEFYVNVLWEATISGIHMDLCLNLKSLDIFSSCG